MPLSELVDIKRDRVINLNMGLLLAEFDWIGSMKARVSEKHDARGAKAVRQVPISDRLDQNFIKP